MAAAASVVPIESGGGAARRRAADVTGRRLAHAPDYRAACASRSRPTAPPDQFTLFYFPSERSDRRDIHIFTQKSIRAAVP